MHFAQPGTMCCAPGKIRNGGPGQLKKITSNALYYAVLAQLYKQNEDVTSLDALTKKVTELQKWADLFGLGNV